MSTECTACFIDPHRCAIMRGMSNSKQSLSSRLHSLVALLLVATTFAFSACMSRAVFDRMPHLEDELAYLYQARIFAGGQIVVDSPQPRQAFWQPFLIDDTETGHRFGKYTPGWPLVLAIGEWYGQPWVINAWLAALSVALLYRFGRDVFSQEVGLLAALLLTFSPMALLLNATLMGHTAALFYALLFMNAYWRLETRPHAFWRVLAWGGLAGFSLGALVMTRPLTAVAVGFPFIAYSGVRVMLSFWRGWFRKSDDADGLRVRLLPFARTITPLVVLSGVTLALASSIAGFNWVATGNPTENLYTRIWEYDRIGFGECCGRNGHTLEKGFRHTRFDLSLTEADLFGWHPAAVTDEIVRHLQTSQQAYPGQGYSFILLPFGVLVGTLWNARGIKDRLVRAGFFGLWAVVVLVGVWIPQNLTTPILGTSFARLVNVSPDIITEPTVSTLWIIAAYSWVLLPAPIMAFTSDDRRAVYTWLFVGIVLGIVLVQMAYWIGSQRYSTRYYFEAIAAAALLSALPLGVLARTHRYARLILYSAVLLICIGSFFRYSLPRIGALHEFNGISPAMIEAIEERRIGDAPVLAIVNGTTSGTQAVRWRSYGALMAITDPYFEHEIIGARDYGTGTMREQIVRQFPDRQIIEIYAAGDRWQFRPFENGGGL